ncbi:YqhR family membrane protein [Paenibacillus puldeungensis]|uniref:YqhR family membrane protein n=1 Tax=Paenibacillus puldeungensis TaxID=696536 RepID=A0ABW3RVW3_9BACL
MEIFRYGGMIANMSNSEKGQKLERQSRYSGEHERQVDTRIQTWRQQRNQRTNIWMFSLEVGFFAGLIWGGLKGVMYFMSFTTVLPGYLVEPFFKSKFLHSLSGYFVGWASFIVFSILATMLYTAAFRKLKGPGPGILYGIAWWTFIFTILGPTYHLTRPLVELSKNTVLSEFCLYVLWGLFIGYTAAEEFTNERGREPKKTPNNALQ